MFGQNSLEFYVKLLTSHTEIHILSESKILFSICRFSIVSVNSQNIGRRPFCSVIEYGMTSSAFKTTVQKNGMKLSWMLCKSCQKYSSFLKTELSVL